MSHLFHVQNTSPQNRYPLGTRIDIQAKEFPALKDMALSLLSLEPQGFREPHWHPNANELGYCLEGRAIMTIFAPGAGHETFTLDPGTLAFIPKGYLHHIQNIGSVPCRLLLCFNDSQPEEIQLSSSVASMPKRILGETFNLEPSFFQGMGNTLSPVFIGKSSPPLSLPLAWKTNRFKMNLSGIHPQVQTKGGAVKMSNQFLMPTLEGLALYDLYLAPKGVREPHWHPNAHELNYLIKGKARITLLSPDEKVDTFEMEAGDMSFLPQGYFHYIENLGENPAQFAVFFNHSTPSDIGLSGALGAYSNELLANLFQVPLSSLDRLPKYQEDLFIVAGGG